MDYKRLYHNLIIKARSENRIKLLKENENYIYYENHHIIPRCLDGSDEDSNLILLTAREHFIAHKILTKIYPNNISIVRAFNLMVYMNKNKYTLSSRDYAYAMELYRNTPVSEETKEKIRRNGNKGRKMSKEFCDKISKSRRKGNLSKGKNNGMYGRKHKPESIQKMRREFSYHHKNLMSKNHADVSGENNPMFGKHASTYIELDINFIKEQIPLCNNFQDLCNTLNINKNTLRGKLKKEFNTNFSNLKKELND